MNICLVGTGYVGLATAACLSEIGNQVHCIDANPDIIAQLEEGLMGALFVSNCLTRTTPAI